MRILCALLILLLASALTQTDASSRTTDDVEVQGVTRPLFEYRLSPTVDEEVREIMVRPGDVVEAGDTLLRLRDDEARLGVDLLELRAGSTLRVDAAKAAWDVSTLEVQESRSAMDDDAIRAPEMRRIELRAERDRLSYQLALQEQRETALQLARARATLARYTLSAPAPGIVTAVNVRVGELPERGAPVIEIVDTSRLRIEIGVPTGSVDGLVPGDAVTVAPETAREDSVLEGRVVFVSPRVQAAAGLPRDNGLRTVHVEFDNPGALPAGGLARVRFSG